MAPCPWEARLKALLSKFWAACARAQGPVFDAFLVLPRWAKPPDDAVRGRGS
jgi:hypothetical protein